MGRKSRRKGASGEREFRDLLRRHGFAARRDGRLDDDLDHDVPETHFEVKRRERYEIDDWLEQAERDAAGRVAVVAFRKSRQPWRVIVDAEHYLALRATKPEGEVGGKEGQEIHPAHHHG